MDDKLKDNKNKQTVQSDINIANKKSLSPSVEADGGAMLRVIISGGGTGGHVFPAIAIANALMQLDPSTQVLFVGAKGRMEMEKVPAAGYKIIGLDIQGLQRKSILKNLMFPFKVIGSLLKSYMIVRDFKPNVAVGVGGYASGPLLYAASLNGVPTLIQEQNSYAGITNKRLGKKASKICVAYDGMEKFFPADKIIKTGNPIRRASVDIKDKRIAGLEWFNLSAVKKTIFVTGASLGASTLNKSILAGMDKLISADVQVIWQTGKNYYTGIIDKLSENFHPNIKVVAFLDRMDLAYAAADIIVSRAGGTISELCVVGKPVILVPSPNVTEDHQTKNAMALVEKNAAIYIADKDAEATMVDVALNLLKDNVKQKTLSGNISKMAIPNADEIIAKEVIKLTINN